jgi:hypothetical protein
VRQVKSRGLGWDPPTPNHEEKQIHGEPDCGDPQGSRCRDESRRCVPQPRNKPTDLLQLEEPVWRTWYLGAQAHQGNRSRTFKAQTHVRGSGDGKPCPQGANRKKALTPTERLEAVGWLVGERSMPIARACSAPP